MRERAGHLLALDLPGRLRLLQAGLPAGGQPGMVVVPRIDSPRFREDSCLKLSAHGG